VIFASQPYRRGMVTILSAVVSIFVFRFRSRAALELKLIAGPAPTTSRLASTFIFRPAAVGVALPDLAAGHRRDDIGQAGNRGAMASQGLPPPLALAITPSWTTQDRHRHPCLARECTQGPST
jgi:hypothetical protein